MVTSHCVAHKVPLATNGIHLIPLVAAASTLLSSTYAYFSRSTCKLEDLHTYQVSGRGAAAARMCPPPRHPSCPLQPMQLICCLDSACNGSALPAVPALHSPVPSCLYSLLYHTTCIAGPHAVPCFATSADGPPMFAPTPLSGAFV